MDARPRLVVLAGVNGAGKSSVGGQALEDAGAGKDAWYNPDTATRELVRRGMELDEANALAWQMGKEQLELAIQEGLPYAFETTLGANTMTRLIEEASSSHRVSMWFCGLDSPERHIERVRARVARGGHDIPTAKIYARYESSRVNLIRLMPCLASLKVYDNSKEADASGEIPDPVLVLHVEDTQMLYPSTQDEFAATPTWAQAIVECALQLAEAKGGLMRMSPETLNIYRHCDIATRLLPVMPGNAIALHDTAGLAQPAARRRAPHPCLRDLSGERSQAPQAELSPQSCWVR